MTTMTSQTYPTDTAMTDTAQLPRVDDPRKTTERRSSYRPDIDHVRYWTGAVLSALIAALAGITALVLIQGLLRVPVFADDHSRILPVSLTAYGLTAAAVALGAAALFNAMVHLAPRPALYYGSLMALITALSVLLPFISPGSLTSQIGLASADLAVGLVVTFLIPMAAVKARR